MLLLQTLCERYWNDLHPQLEQEQGQEANEPRDAAEGRANILRWLDQKLIPTLRQAPMIAAEDGGNYTWTAWEQAAQAGNADDVVVAALTATPSSLLSEQRTALQDALKTIELTQQTFDNHLGTAAPRLDLLANQVSDILQVLQSELQKREPAPPPPAVEPAPPPLEPPPATPRFRNRADAYACLAEAAAYLAEVEPHSPTPYLVKRAVEWGNMNTGALYQELFIRLGGQLSIFDMVGSDMLTAPPQQR
jgi:type VI secretion system protein ImpA